MLRVSRHSELTDTGRQRQANEDSFLVREPLFVVADGMGGAQAGEVASMTAVQAFENGLPPGNPEEALQATIALANRTIHDQAHSDSSLAGMGTTITAAALNAQDEMVVIGHVGDSRAYRLRDGILQRLTKDHSLVEEMRRRGQITEAQAEDHPQRSIITRALGPEPEVQADIQSVPSAPGDLFLLCSDGLTTMLGDERIKELLIGSTSLDAATRALIDEANRAGGRDNITVVLFQVEDPAEPLLEGGPGNLPPAGGTRAARRADEDGGRGRRGRGGAVAGRLLIGCAVLAVLIGGLFFASRQVWFLGTDDAGRVALYRGLPYELPFGISLYDERYSTAIQTSELDQTRQDSVRGHSLRSRDDATDLIEDIESQEGI
jgi:PPM family protein phosphatase